MSEQGINNKALVEQLHRIADVLENTQKKESVHMNEEEKKKAAYALNLCLVSVSQIIEYADIYILEQEYQGILNNLNLENMPKDEALLDILRQILDTVTFFRIQEEEKKFIENDYQKKMKSAIWKALPNCQVILGAGKLRAMLGMLIYQVGTGYMNYRNAKAEATQAKEKKLWELQRSAIEQFSGLRSELFTTAWKLSERYNFDDAWRLTENQITQYNRVLMDRNSSRRLARLEDLEESFQAYPPFWYFKGHTAFLLYQENQEEMTDMKIVAQTAFEKYFSINDYGQELLRADSIYATCALEYVALMDVEETERKQEYIQRAIKQAGANYDILQLCAMAYLDIGSVERASRILRHLICEGYNANANAQVLSALYIEGHLGSGEKDTRYQKQYDFLCNFVEEGQLIPWPQVSKSTVQEQYADFIANRREALLENYADIMAQYYSYKARECRNVVMYSEDREQNLIRFVRTMRDELSEFPHAKIAQGEFVRRIKSHQEQLEKMISSGKCTNRIFEEVFGEVFLSIARSIAQIRLRTMEEITRLEIELGTAAGRFKEKVAENILGDENQQEDTLRAFLEIKTELSAQFLKIKSKVKKRKLVKEGAKHTKLLISGEQEYYEYIEDRRLKEAQVVAILNDTSVLDCDLIIGEKGIWVQHTDADAVAGTKFLLFGPAALVEMGIRSALSGEINYADVTYTAEKLQKPRFKNKEVNMEELCRLIDEIKEISVDDSFERKLYCTIASAIYD